LNKFYPFSDSHHETSLARATNLETDTHRPSTEELDKQHKQHLKTTTKALHGGGKGGVVSKLIKPSLKGNVVKACLGMQRISGGSNGGGRLSSRPRRSSSLGRSVKPIKKVNIIHRSGGGLLQQRQQQKKAGPDPRYILWALVLLEFEPPLVVPHVNNVLSCCKNYCFEWKQIPSLDISYTAIPKGSTMFLLSSTSS
jgi:hypothetical protein